MLQQTLTFIQTPLAKFCRTSFSKRLREQNHIISYPNYFVIKNLHLSELITIIIQIAINLNRNSSESIDSQTVLKNEHILSAQTVLIYIVTSYHSSSSVMNWSKCSSKLSSISGEFLKSTHTHTSKILYPGSLIFIYISPGHFRYTYIPLLSKYMLSKQSLQINFIIRNWSSQSRAV